MLRLIRSTAFLGTILLTGAAVAQTKAPASDDNLIESSKPGNPSAAAKADEAAPAPVAVPAPPPPDDESVADAPKAQKKRTISSAGLSTQSTTQGGAADLGDSTSEKDWGFRFKGFFRGPMRLGIDNSGSLTPNTTQLHAPPVVPDGNYTRWMYTNINPGPWAELLFQYGNQRVMMTTSIASYNITSGGWRELQDQLGIDRAFLTLKFPEALGNLGGMAWDVGVFSNLYGAAGKYDAGQYETYMIARTRVAGATATADMELSDDLKLVLEAGGGAKMDQQYQRYQVSQGSDVLSSATYDYPSWQPFPGNKVQQGTNILLHGHAGLVISGILTATAHYLDSFVKDARWNVGSTGGSPNSKPSDIPGDGSIQIFGLDFKLNGGYLGDGYLGLSYVKAHHAGSVGDTVELLHSQGGSYLVQNYFTSPAQAKSGATPDGNGNIMSLGGQYTFSVASFMMRPRPFWGQAADVTIRPFFMYNKVSGTQDGAADVSKLKAGLDVIYSFMPMMSVGMRGDIVQPNMSNSHQSFGVITPKAIFRSEFVTHEMVILSVSKYFYGAEYLDKATSPGVMPWPYGQFGTNETALYGSNGSPPDSWVINLAASMWW
jgi:hypothetical protein